MPSKTKAVKAAMAALPSIPKELIDQFVTGPMSAEAVNAASIAFKKALIERALGAELGHHLGYPSGAAKPEDAATNQRNGTSGKTLRTNDGPLRIEVPRDRDATFTWHSVSCRRQARHPRAVDRRNRGCQVLDEGVQRPEDARRGRYPDRRHRWPEGYGRGPRTWQ